MSDRKRGHAKYALALTMILCLVCNVANSSGICSDQKINITNVYVSFDDVSEKFRITDSKDSQTVAHAQFSNCMNSSGFAYLTISTVNSYTYQLNSSIQAYAAGIAEGYVTRELISLQYLNLFGDFCQTRTTQCDRLEDFFRQNLQWTFEQVLANPDDNYWYQVRLFFEQLRGLQDGFDGQPGPISMNVKQIFGPFLLTVLEEVNDILEALSGQAPTTPIIGHCSVLIKVLQDQTGVKDVLMAHDTWNSYNSMLRILKRYNFYLRKVPTGSEPILGHSMTFSSYPGAIVSIDDFYVLSSAMIVTETTNPVYTPALYKKIQPKSVLESVRVTVANRLAEHGDDWSKTFSSHNSGTYNNQWMVVDLKRYDEAFHKVLPGFLTVLEQIPGSVHFEDQTSVLLNTTYWASYNVPFYQDIYKASGLQTMVDKYGDFFTHDHCPRGNIFRRDQSKVTDLESMTRLMRYNDFQHDPLSKCNCTPPYSAVNAISARNDLNPPSGAYPFKELGFALSGGTDMKLTSINIAMDTLSFMAISGPTYDPLPPFQWSKAYNGSVTPHFGQPDVFKFSPVWFNGTL